VSQSSRGNSCRMEDVFPTCAAPTKVASKAVAQMRCTSMSLMMLMYVVTSTEGRHSLGGSDWLHGPHTGCHQLDAFFTTGVATTPVCQMLTIHGPC
jgi:hypothetical protein